MVGKSVALRFGISLKRLVKRKAGRSIGWSQAFVALLLLHYMRISSRDFVLPINLCIKWVVERVRSSSLWAYTLAMISDWRLISIKLSDTVLCCCWRDAYSFHNEPGWLLCAELFTIQCLSVSLLCVGSWTRVGRLAKERKEREGDDRHTTDRNEIVSKRQRDWTLHN